MFVSDSKLYYLNMYVERENVKTPSHRMRSLSQKEMRRELQSISKEMDILSVQGPSFQPSIVGIRGAMSRTTTQ